MWWDELNDPDYKDTKIVPSLAIDYSYYHRPITAFNCTILHAVTGANTGYKMGSTDEYRFYVVMESDPDSPKEARRLYFSSPDEYEQCTGIQVNERSRERFIANRLKHVF